VAKAPPAKKSVGGGMMGFFIIMLIVMGAYSITPIRDGIAQVADIFLGPFFSIFGGENHSWLIVILVLSALTGLYSSLLQKYTIDYEKMQVQQQKTKDFQKVFREAQLSGDEKAINKLSERRAKLMEDQMEMSQEQFKPMGWIMIITVPIWIWLYWTIGNFPAGAVPTITFPYWGELALSDPTALFLPAWIIWYMICSLSLSQVIRKGLNIGGI